MKYSKSRSHTNKSVQCFPESCGWWHDASLYPSAMCTEYLYYAYSIIWNRGRRYSTVLSLLVQVVHRAAALAVLVLVPLRALEFLYHRGCVLRLRDAWTYANTYSNIDVLESMHIVPISPHSRTSTSTTVVGLFVVHTVGLDSELVVVVLR